jgi:hypothetical protein
VREGERKKKKEKKKKENTPVRSLLLLMIDGVKTHLDPTLDVPTEMRSSASQISNSINP